MPRILLTIAYDGHPYSGWQSQPCGKTVQDHLEKSLAALCGTSVRVHGAGRTDGGVHALAQSAHVDLPDPCMPVGKIPVAVNARLPTQIRVVAARRVGPDFHARFSAKGKVYRYRVWNAPTLHPLEIGRAWHVPEPVDLARLREAVSQFEGRHDFFAFAANRRTPVGNTVRTIRSARVRREGALLTLTFDGDGFLFRMVRLMAGAALRVGKGREPMEWLSDHLKRRAQGKARYCAPSDGLYLVRVRY